MTFIAKLLFFQALAILAARTFGILGSLGGSPSPPCLEVVCVESSGFVVVAVVVVVVFVRFASGWAGTEVSSSELEELSELVSSSSVLLDDPESAASASSGAASSARGELDCGADAPDEEGPSCGFELHSVEIALR